MSKNRVRSLLIIMFGILLFLFLYFNHFDCFFKKYLGISCPGCGMYRAFKEIFSFHLLNSFNYNVLALPAFICLILVSLGLVYDFIFNVDKYFKLYFYLLNRNYLLIIIFVLISYGINLCRGI